MARNVVYKLIFKMLVCVILAAAFFITGCETDPENKTGEPAVETDVIKYDLVKREFRGVWISTVYNIDVPPSASETSFRNTFNNILDVVESYNMNAIVFQASPMLDAWWDSQINPWSQYLTGMRQGSPPRGNTIWDPMEVMIELCHQRAIEFHVWLNPYRVAPTYSQVTAGGITYRLDDLDALPVPELIDVLNRAGRLADNNFAVLNSHTVYRGRKVGGVIGNDYRQLFLDPAYDEVIDHIAATVNELMTKYDICAIHYDDYFYPYNFTFTNGGFEALEESWNKFAVPAGYQNNKQDWDQWLRDNNCRFVEVVRDTIRKHNRENNKAVQFGISPIGIWARSDVQGGVNLPGSTSFTYTGGIYADIRKWVLEEWIDYMIPQIYWSFENQGSPYNAITDWWTTVHSGKDVNLYVGHGVYQYAENPIPIGFTNSNQILRQLEFNRERPIIKGSIFFTFRDLTRTGGTLGASNTMIKNYWNTKALIPEMPWLNSTKPAAPQNVTRSGTVISWDDTANTRYYIVYRISTQTFMSEVADFIIEDPSKIIAKVWRNEGSARHSFTDTTQSPSKYTYYVTAVNNAHLESMPSAAAK